MRNPCKNNKLIEGCTKLFTANTQIHKQRERNEQQQERVLSRCIFNALFTRVVLHW